MKKVQQLISSLVDEKQKAEDQVKLYKRFGKKKQAQEMNGVYIGLHLAITKAQLLLK